RLLRDESQPGLPPTVVGAWEPLRRSARLLAVPDAEEALAVAEHVPVSRVRVLLRRTRGDTGCGRRLGRRRRRRGSPRRRRGRHRRGRPGAARGGRIGGGCRWRGRGSRRLVRRLWLLRHGFCAWDGQVAVAVPALDRLVLDLFRAVRALLHRDPPALGGPWWPSLPSPVGSQARR